MFSTTKWRIYWESNPVTLPSTVMNFRMRGLSSPGLVGRWTNRVAMASQKSTSGRRVVIYVQVG
ncbi:hypothetical protein [Nostoc sp.]|uniref:hypothetical protein n=1 Tax=Nostoc sp. TaxID=1180 RepID=UPI002FF96194